MVELLIVVAILSILAVATSPVLSGLLGARNLARTAGDVSDYLEFARSEAIAKNTFVWVGFASAEQNGTAKLALSIVASRDGSPDASSSNLVPLQRNLSFMNVRLATDAEANAANSPLKPLAGEVTGHADIVNTMTRGSQESANFTSAQTTFGHTITFTPQGEALLVGIPSSITPLEPFIGLFLQKMRGTEPTSDLAPLLINGASGQVRTIAL